MWRGDEIMQTIIAIALICGSIYGSFGVKRETYTLDCQKHFINCVDKKAGKYPNSLEEGLLARCIQEAKFEKK